MRMFEHCRLSTVCKTQVPFLVSKFYQGLVVHYPLIFHWGIKKLFVIKVCKISDINYLLFNFVFAVFILVLLSSVWIIIDVLLFFLCCDHYWEQISLTEYALTLSHFAAIEKKEWKQQVL